MLVSWNVELEVPSNIRQKHFRDKFHQIPQKQWVETWSSVNSEGQPRCFLWFRLGMAQNDQPYSCLIYHEQWWFLLPFSTIWCHNFEPLPFVSVCSSTPFRSRRQKRWSGSLDMLFCWMPPFLGGASRDASVRLGLNSPVNHGENMFKHRFREGFILDL